MREGGEERAVEKIEAGREKRSERIKQRESGVFIRAGLDDLMT